MGRTYQVQKGKKRSGRRVPAFIAKKKLKRKEGRERFPFVISELYSLSVLKKENVEGAELMAAASLMWGRGISTKKRDLLFLRRTS